MHSAAVAIALGLADGVEGLACVRLTSLLATN